jgi:hypothetical protein
VKDAAQDTSGRHEINLGASVLGSYHDNSKKVVYNLLIRNQTLNKDMAFHNFTQSRSGLSQHNLKT